MKQQDAEEYTQSLGQIVAGSWRQVALAKRLGVPKALGLTTEQWVNERLGGYVKMSIAERREAVLELAAGGHSNREIGAVLGVDEKTVRNDGAENSAVDERKPNNGAIAGDEGAENSAPLDAVAALAAGAQARSFDVLSSSNSVEWYTPPAIVELVSQVLGGVDIDPCWHPESPVKAATTYVLEQDGLSRDWRGRVYLNPPYGREIDDWIEKLVGEHSAGRTTEAIALLPARVDTEWFRRLDAFPRCFLYGRLTFANAENPAPFPCAAVYLGNDVGKVRRRVQSGGWRLGAARERRAMTARARLPNRRLAESFSFECNSLRYTCTIGRYADGRIGELFLNNHKSNSHADANARDSAIVCSLALQHGVPLETIRRALLRDSQGRPSTPLGTALDRIGEEDAP